MVLLIMFRLNNERYSYIQILEMYLNSVLDKGTAFSLLTHEKCLLNFASFTDDNLCLKMNLDMQSLNDMFKYMPHRALFKIVALCSLSSHVFSTRY